MSKCLGLNPWVLGFVLLSPYHSGSVSDFFMAIPDILLCLLLSKCHLLFSLLTIKLSNECCISSSLELALISCIIINGLILSQSCFSQACQRKLFFFKSTLFLVFINLPSSLICVMSDLEFLVLLFFFFTLVPWLKFFRQNIPWPVNHFHIQLKSLSARKPDWKLIHWKERWKAVSQYDFQPVGQSVKPKLVHQWNSSCSGLLIIYRIETCNYGTSLSDC